MCSKTTSGAQNIFNRVESSSTYPFTYESTYDNSIFQQIVNYSEYFLKTSNNINTNVSGYI